MKDERKEKLRKGLEQLNDHQLKLILKAQEMITDEYFYKDRKY